jgi:D-arabinose 1-dehydrogenase-like Zn-dependent alcohol dehydrogenase
MWSYWNRWSWTSWCPILGKNGNEVTDVTITDENTELIKTLGATEVLNINNTQKINKHLYKYGFVINTARSAQVF